MSLVEALSALGCAARPSYHHGRRAHTSRSDKSDVVRPRAPAILRPCYAPRADRAPGSDRDTPSTAVGFAHGLPGLPLPPLAGAYTKLEVIKGRTYAQEH